MITLSAFADEIGPDLTLQMDVLDSQGIKCLDVRGIDGRNVSTFTAAEVRQYAGRLADRGFSVACIGSPIGKISMDDDFGAHLALLRKCCEVAHGFGTRNIRIFSFYASKGSRIVDQRAGVFARLEAMLEVARREDVFLLHENEHDIYGEFTGEVLDLLTAYRGTHMGGIFDPANFAQGAGLRPFDQCWTQGLADLTDYFHIKDHKAGEECCCPAGEGDGQIDRILADVKQRKWSGVMSIEPHMAATGRFAGFSGPEMFVQAASALKGMLDQAGLKYQ